jgi:thiol:disulfide interchange protein
MNRRRFLSLSAFAIFAVGCDAQTAPRTMPASSTTAAKSLHLEHFGDDFAAARAEAARDRKPLLIYFTADWCTYCRQLEREVLDRPDFRAAAGQFVCVRVDAGRQTGRCEEYRVRAYPTIVLTDPSGTAIDRIVGLSTPTAVVTQMNAAATSAVAVLPEPPSTTLQR